MRLANLQRQRATQVRIGKREVRTRIVVETTNFIAAWTRSARRRSARNFASVAFAVKQPFVTVAATIAKIRRIKRHHPRTTIELPDHRELIHDRFRAAHEIRFGDAIRFEYDIDPDLLDIKVPPLIIQPLVENATIHGIGHLESGGVIKISLEKRGDAVRIGVEDNGAGMDEETRQKILKCQSPDCNETGHTTGIGIYNVVQRLRLFFSCEDVVDVESAPGRGTKVVLKIPCDAVSG